MTPTKQTYFEAQLKGLREQMDRPQFDSVWSKGYSLIMEQAFALALED